MSKESQKSKSEKDSVSEVLQNGSKQNSVAFIVHDLATVADVTTSKLAEIKNLM